jgi:hypothetical protein
MNNCGSYGDDLVLEYRVPIRTNVNVQSGAITSRSSGSARPGAGCGTCPSGAAVWNTGSGWNAMGLNNGRGAMNGNGNGNGNPNCVIETRGNTRYKTCYYSNGTTTMETYPGVY